MVGLTGGRPGAAAAAAAIIPPAAGIQFAPGRNGAAAAAVGPNGKRGTAVLDTDAGSMTWPGAGIAAAGGGNCPAAPHR